MIVRVELKRSPVSSALKLILAILLLVVTLKLLDAKLPLQSLAHIKFRWVLLGIAAWTVAQFASALRWRFTAERMQAPISMRFAVVECYIASLLNQTLLFGVGGDAMRITRHGASLKLGSAGYALALRTHLVERVAGQTVLALFACLGAMAWMPSVPSALLIACAAVLMCLLASVLWRRNDDLRLHTPTRLLAWLDEAHSALFVRNAWRIQLGLSTVIIVGCLSAFFCAALALEVELSLRDVLRIGPLVLAAMALPLGAGGFGPREVASAALFSANALDPGRGTLVSLLYGFMSVLASLPAIPLWLLREPAEAVADE